MRGKQDHAFGIGAGALADHVAGLVRVNLKTARREKLFQSFAATRFAKFRRGNFREVNLLLGYPGRVFFDPVEGSRERGSLAIFARESSVARAGNMAIHKKIQQMRASFTRFVGRILSPVVKDIHPGAIVAGRWAAGLHGDALDLDAKPACDHKLERFAAREVHSGCNFVRANPARK